MSTDILRTLSINFIIRSYALLTCSIPTWTQLTQEWAHTPERRLSRHVSPNSARFSYIAERALFYLRADVYRRGQRPPKGLGTNMTVEATQRPSTHVNTRRTRPGQEKEKGEKEEEKEKKNEKKNEKKFRLDSNDFGFI